MSISRSFNWSGRCNTQPNYDKHENGLDITFHTFLTFVTMAQRVWGCVAFKREIRIKNITKNAGYAKISVIGDTCFGTFGVGVN